MVPMVYQAYPGGPQQVYYVPAAQGPHGHTGAGVLEGLNSKIRALASTDKLEGFSFKELFKETFKKRGADEVDDYLMVGSSRTTPPLELVDTNWPKPWMFFRLLAGLVIAYVAFYLLYIYTLNEKPMMAIMILVTLAVPIALLTLLWEMNTPRNVSIAQVIKMFVVGGGLAIVFSSLLYMIPAFTISASEAGFVEESSKLLAVILVTWGFRGARYPYQLNGIVFGAAVGAGFAISESLGYGWDSFIFNPQGLIQFITSGGMQQLVNQLSATLPKGAGIPDGALVLPLMKITLQELTVRAVQVPGGHIVWTAISAGAFWRVKGDRPANLSMLLDGRFLRAFIIPMSLHALWDSPLAEGSNSATVQWVGAAVLTVIAWYVLFTMIQQGLHQVRDMQKAQLQHTYEHVQATLGLGTVRPPMAPAPVAIR